MSGAGTWKRPRLGRKDCSEGLSVPPDDGGCASVSGHSVSGQVNDPHLLTASGISVSRGGAKGLGLCAPRLRPSAPWQGPRGRAAAGAGRSLRSGPGGASAGAPGTRGLLRKTARVGKHGSAWNTRGLGKSKLSAQQPSNSPQDQSLH